MLGALIRVIRKSRPAKPGESIPGVWEFCRVESFHFEFRHNGKRRDVVIEWPLDEPVSEEKLLKAVFLKAASELSR